MNLRYSFKVVAPIICISPLANAGLKRLAASNEPVVAPAPTIVWSSSIKIIVFERDSKLRY